MPCLTPVIIKRQYRTMNGGFTDIFPCGKCPECLRKRANDWVFRLREEQKNATSAIFLTLTYSDENLLFGNIEATLYKKDFQLFMKRLRKQLNYDKDDQPIKYYMCGEYGTTTQRPHYHAIMFNLPNTYTTISSHLTNIWGKGQIDIGTCTPASITYVAKYMMKGKLTEEQLNGREPEFSLMSKYMGISYLSPSMVKYFTSLKTSLITKEGGVKQQLPRYFKNKIFNKQERQELALESLKYAQEKLDQFRDESHLLDWKKHQYLRQQKLKILERNTL